MVRRDDLVRRVVPADSSTERQQESVYGAHL